MSGRRRTSKWDLPQSPTEHGNSRMSFHDGGSDQNSSGILGSNSMKGSFVESSESRKHYSSNQVKESFSESRFSEKERDNMKNRDSMKDSESFDGGGNYSMRISPGLEEWRKRSRSPRSRPGRSLRSRSWSRSWSRSRSRSRSPSRGYKHESGVNDKCRSRSGLSTQPCRDFLSGKCRRGDDCHFLHQNNRNFGERRYPENGSPDGYESRHRRDGNSTYSGNDGRELPVREGRLLRERDDGIKNRDSSFERGGWRDSREPRRVSDIPCRFFAAGNCRNGESCRFSHNAKAGSSFDGKSRDDRWAKEHTSDYPDQSRDSKRNDAGRGDLEMWNEDKHRNQGATWNEERHRNQDGPMRNEERHRNQGATWNEERPRNQDGPMRIEERHRNQDGPMRNEENHRNQDVLTMNDDKRRKEEKSTWNEERHPSHGLSELKSRVGPLPRTDLDSNMILGGPGSFDKAVAINGSETFPLKLENTDSSRVAKEFKKTDNTWLGDMEMSPEWNYTVQAPNDARNDEYGYVSRSTHSINLSEASLPTSEDNSTQDVSGQISHAVIATKPIVLENSYVQQYPRLNNDVVFPFNSRNLTGNGSGSNIDSNFSVNNLPGQNVYSNGLSSTVPSLYSTSSVVKSQPTLTTPSQGASQISSEFLTGQPSVSTEQIAQITNISASLAQIFGNQQQIPQLYAALNTAKAMGPLPSVPHSNKPIAPISAPTQPITASALFSPNSIAHRDIGDKKSELSLKDSTPISMTIGQNGGSFQGADNLEVRNHEDEKLKHSELATIGEIKKKNEMVPEESKTVVPVSKKLGEDSPVDNMDEGGVNEGKKSKEVKGLRAFKFALVECVKDLLKMPWKEGKVNKDSYKVIVKKVSEKVTSTIQAANIPQTPEKIDQYLSFSKPKLTKLVQAYVEKYQKS